MDDLLLGLSAVVVWPAIGYLTLGVLIGFAVGLLPALNGLVAMALIIPFAFGMEPVPALCLVLGMHSVLGTSGDVTSVLWAIPGEGSSAAAILDGHPMTRRGQAGRALSIVLLSSMMGALIGAVLLAVSLPVIRPLILRFGPPELFMLAILGLSFLVALTGRDIAKGTMMASFGFLVGLVGQQVFAGTPRFTFGSLELSDGISVVPLALGLFGVPEVAAMFLGSGRTAMKQASVSLAGVRQGLVDCLKHWRILIQSSLIGVGVGAVPGLGGGVAQWIAYARAKASSKEPEKFGRGAEDGLIAVGAVNNSKEGGSLIPTIAFAVPGSPSMALLLVMFLFLGLVPGRNMLTQNLDVSFAMVWILVIANVLGVVLAILLLRYILRIRSLPNAVLGPILATILVIGSFAESNRVFDVMLMLVFGVIGIACVRWNWPRPPFLLAVVLADLTERNLFLSTNLFGWSWLYRPFVLVVAVGIVLVLTKNSRWRRTLRSSVAKRGRALSGRR